MIRLTSSACWCSAATRPGTTIAERRVPSRPMSMKLQLVPARRGILWVRQGFAVFLRQPMGFAGLFAIFLFAVFTLSLLPAIGPLLLLALLPLASLGFMVATRRAL